MPPDRTGSAQPRQTLVAGDPALLVLGPLMLQGAAGEVRLGGAKPRRLLAAELHGDVVGCDRCVLGPRSRFFGNIETRNLSITEGAYIDGNVRMTRTPAEKTTASGER